MKTKDDADLISPQGQQALVDAEHKTSAELLGEPAEKEGHFEDHMKREEQQEMKIAFGSNKQGADNSSADSVQGVKSLLQSAPEEAQAQAQAAAEPAEEPVTTEEPRENAVKWEESPALIGTGRTALQQGADVHRAERGDAGMIASRYSLNPKEIVLYNRLDSDRVYEGQVIYIPTSG